MKIRTVGVDLFHVEGRKDRRTYVAKLTVAFRNFANAPKIVKC
jgi:collagenase-like PrtC family protease